MLLVTILVALTELKSISARSPLYGNCSIANNHLDANTKAFVTDCDSFGYCGLNGTCLPRLCRHDEFVLTSLLDTGGTTVAPPLCVSGTFCPDDASGCLPLVAVGGQCQLNRDDECIPPKSPLVIPNPYDSNSQESSTGVLCLLELCTYSNVTLGGTCITESTPYIGYDVTGQSFTNLVTRDNCVEGQGYCDLTSNTCLSLKMIDDTCAEDRECQSYNCNPSNVCVIPPESEVYVPVWVYVLVSLCIAASMAAILFVLVHMHKKSQEKKRILLEDYYKEQTSYRHSILSFHSALESKDIQRTMSNLSDMTMVDGKG